MLINLVKITKNSFNDYSLGNIYINPSHIVFMCEDRTYKADLVENKMNLDLDKNVEFTKIKFSDSSAFGEVVVIGSPDAIQNKLHTQQKILLRD